ncbi:MAG: ATP-binding protein [Sphaerochaetaceae bacterium]|nr:ATP-binding protein [uncultured Sphaerochaeta sp.]MDC7229032.1 ATP-binding protein [Sphaerochaetaceae bacterium]
MKNFVQRAIQKIDQLDTNQIVEILKSQSSDLEMLESVLESIQDGVILTDERKIVHYANSRCRTLIPMARMRNYEGMALSRVIEDEHVLHYIMLALKGKHQDEENEFTFQKGTKMQTIAVTVYSYLNSSERMRSSFVIMLSDVTEHNANEARLRRSENLASMTTMAAGVAHEIKNPLAAMGIHLQLLKKAFERKESLTLDDAERYLSVLEEEISRLNGIVVDFLFAVRPMDTRLRLAQMTKTLEDICSFVEPELEEHSVYLIKDFASSLPRLEYDEHLLKQAVLNLIKNAMNAMEGGGKLILQTRLDGDHVVLKIQDTGIGMDEETQQKIFEPYFTTKATGTGLGLTVVYKILKEHKGDITVQSKLGEGTVFTLTFPVPKSERLALKWDTVAEVHYES